MTRTINIPFTCDQIKLSLLIGITILFIISIYQVSQSDKLSESEIKLTVLGLLFGFVGSFIGWIIALICWDTDNKLPKFKCRCDK